MKLFGAGFIVTPAEAAQTWSRQHAGPGAHIRLYRNGHDLTATPRNVMVIDLFGLTAEGVRRVFPPCTSGFTSTSNRNGTRTTGKATAKNGGFLRTNPELTSQLFQDYPATSPPSNLAASLLRLSRCPILPDNNFVNIALDDAYFLGVLSSRIHVTWALAAGSWLGVGNDPVYVKTACFEKFPFPAATDAQQARRPGHRRGAGRPSQAPGGPASGLT